jgi:alpha-N-acetylglucosamine transferase
VYVDADAIPLRRLDDLFALPLDGPLAAPRAYWLPQPYWCTGLLVVRPSLASWDRVSRHFISAFANRFFDMDIINNEYAGEIITLPTGTFCLDSEWEDVERPGPLGDFGDTYARAAVVHFSALGKPWFYPVEKVRHLRPNAHPIFYELWDMWRKTKQQLFLAPDRDNARHHPHR